MLYTLGKLSFGAVGFTRLKPLVLLAYLSLEGQQSRAHLGQLFWSQAKDPLGALSVALSRLRQVYPDIESDQYSVKSTLSADALMFSRAIERGNYRAALDLYEGPFLAGITLPDWNVNLESWVYATRETLAAQAQTCLLKLAERYAQEGRAELAAQYADTAYTLPAAPPLEAKTLMLIFNLLQQGNHEAAKMVAAEAEELGVTLVKAVSSRAKVNETTPHNLSSSRDAFVGRQEEITTLSKQLSDPNCRLLTLMGPGGIGKSRLALNVAHAQLSKPHFKDGVYLASLESLTSADLIPTRIVEALELSPKGQEAHLDLIRSYVGEKSMLLVLDNMEHLLGGVSTVSVLLSSCPELKFLTTSRARLNLVDEWVFRVGGLSYPSPNSEGDPLSYDAPRLFAERAKQSRLDLALTSDEYETLVRLCDLTGGAPLALEFAAAWLSTMSLNDVVHEVEQGMEVLQATQPIRDKRHQSMEGVFAQSWQRLPAEDQAALRELSVFEGGFTREAALEVAGVGLEQLMRLISTSFVTLEQSGRYGFHPLTKQYLEQRLIELNEVDRVKRRHAIYSRNLAKRAEPNFEEYEQAVWLEQLDKELDNFRVALRWSIDEAETKMALELAVSLEAVWRIRNSAEGLSWLSKVLDLPSSKDKKLVVRVLKLAGQLAELQGEWDTAYHYLREGVSINEVLGDQALMGDLFNCLGIVMSRLGDHSAARNYTEESLLIKRNLKDSRGIAKALNHLGTIEMLQGNYDVAHTHYRESLALYRTLKDLLHIATVLVNLGGLEESQGNHAAARHYYNEAMEINKVLKHHYGVAMVLNNLGVLEEDLKRYSLAQAHYKACLTLSQDIGCYYMMTQALNNLSGLASIDRNYEAAQRYTAESLQMSSALNLRSTVVASLEDAASIACRLDKFIRAAHLWGNVEKLRHEMEEPLAAHKQQAYEQEIATARAKLDPEIFEAAWDAGQKMTLEEAVAYALN